MKILGNEGKFYCQKGHFTAGKSIENVNIGNHLAILFLGRLWKICHKVGKNFYGENLSIGGS